MDLEQIFSNMGFKPLETKIYLHLLKSGPQTQQLISDQTLILRQTVYEIILKLETKGVVSRFVSGKKKLYSAVNPSIFLERTKSQLDDLRFILPQLEKMSNFNVSNHFSENFTGIQGLKSLFDLTLKSKTPILWLANEKSHIEIFKDYYWENYALKRKDNHIEINLLINSTVGKSFWSTNRKELRNVRQSSLVNKIESSFAVFEDKVLIYSIEKTNAQGVLIKNKQISKMFDLIFKNIWINSKEV